MSVYDLWLPILIGGLATHVISVIAWTVSPHHKPDWKQLPDQDAFLAWLAEKNLPPEQYIFPHMDSAKAGESHEGCQGTLVLWPKPPNMGVNIALTLSFFLVASYVIGYLASLGVAPGATFMDVFQFVTTAGLLTYCAGIFPGVFWFRRKVAMDLLDGVVQAIAIGLIFAALWPAAA